MPPKRNGDGLYKRSNGTYHYDVGKGLDRITFSTGMQNRREARIVVKQELAQRKFSLSRVPNDHTAHLPPASKNGISLEEVLERWIEKQRTTITNQKNFKARVKYAKHLVEELGPHKSISSVEAHDLRKIANRYRDATKSPSGKILKEETINMRVRNPMRGMFKLALSELKIANLPFIDWSTVGRNPNNERTRYLRTHEMLALVKVAPDQDALVHEFMWLTGIRAAAVLNLRWRDVDEDLGIVSFRNKGGAVHVVPLTSKTRQILRTVHGYHNKDQKKFVFTHKCRYSEKRVPYTYGCFSKRARKTFRRAGIEDYVLHDHRHTAACLAFCTSKFNIYAVQELLGHRHIESCDRYVHLDRERLRQDLEKISSWAPSSLDSGITKPQFFSDGLPALSIAFLRANDNVPDAPR